MFDKSRHCDSASSVIARSSATKQTIAVTGPMAAGKNYICSQMEKEGWSTIDADLLVHDAIELVKDRILNTFIPYAEQQNLKLKKEDGSVQMIRRAQEPKDYFATFDCFDVYEKLVNTSGTKKPRG